MDKHEWKIGDWAEFPLGRAECLGHVLGGSDIDFWWRIQGGVPFEYVTTFATHLPDCTGWDWKAPENLQLREGAWYERRDGRTVGPCFRRKVSESSSYLWQVGENFYMGDGSWNTSRSEWGLDLIREVDAPTDASGLKFEAGQSFERSGKKYEPIEFRSPKIGEDYLAHVGIVSRASSYDINPHIIVREIVPEWITPTDEDAKQRPTVEVWGNSGIKHSRQLLAVCQSKHSFVVWTDMCKLEQWADCRMKNPLRGEGE